MRKPTAPLLLAALLALLAAGCQTLGGGAWRGPKTQGWTEQVRFKWYAATQGSRLVPLSWARALRDANTGRPFFSDASLTRFGYLPSTTAPGLPFAVGFAIDDSSDAKLTYTHLRWYKEQGTREEWLGLNCAACHTGVIEHDGQRLLVDGAPTMADFQSFTEAFDASLSATLTDPTRFDAFAKQVLAGRDTPANRAMLHAELTKLVDWEARVAQVNQAAIRYGPARLDAVGHIFNKLVLLALWQKPIAFAGNPSDAPVSYPFLWNTHQSDKLQWNGEARTQVVLRNFDVGALGRNAGEVLGVFGDAAIRPNAGLRGYPSSVQVSSLAGLELVLSRLEQPLWPAAMLGPIDPARVEQGRTLFANNCVACHRMKDSEAVLPPLDLTAKILASMQPLAEAGTDQAMACNAYLASAPTGWLEGTKIGYFGDGKPFVATGQLTDMLPTVVKGVIVKQKIAVLTSGAIIFAGGIPSPRVVPPTGRLEALPPPPRDCTGLTNELLAYKGRPLNGVWATAPYLHNGSVPTLYDLVSPENERHSTFHVGSREFDPVHVGFVTDPSAANWFTFDTSQPGNLNTGHNYTVDKATGKTFTPDQRRALVEYMKTL